MKPKVHYDEWAWMQSRAIESTHSAAEHRYEDMFSHPMRIARSCQNQRTASIIAIAKHISYGPHCPCKAQKRYISMYIYDIWYITYIYSKRVGPAWHNCNCLWAWCEPCRYNPPICSFAIGEQKQGQIAIVLQRLMLWAILFKGLFIVQRCRLG